MPVSPKLSRLFCTTATLTIVSLAPTVWADTDAGSYLAARQAGLNGDYSTAAGYFQDTLAADGTNVTLMQHTMTSYLGSGDVAAAAAIAEALVEVGHENQAANIATMAEAARTRDWPAIFDMLEAGREVGPLIDALAQAWGYVGLGQMDRALESFDDVIDSPGLRSFGQQHKAMALTIMGDFEAADAIYSLPPTQGIIPTRDTIAAHLQILCRLGQFDKARDIITQAFGSDVDAEIVIIRDAIAAQDIPQLETMVSNPAEGIADAFKSLSDLLQGEAEEGYLLLYAQAARYIAPQDADTHIAAARLLNEMGQYDAAAKVFAQVQTDGPAFHNAEMGRAEALRLDGRLDQAIEVLTQLTRSHPEVPIAYASLGDIYRQQKDYPAANTAYGAALDVFSEDAPVRWWLHYSRGITFERMGDWPPAEADFRRALDLNPDHPSVLNYLGYSLVDLGLTEAYDEALQMIETAAAARADSGAITDSLGWIYFKLGRFQEAVGPMERAVELEPNDPIISDHLGDVYWQVGREVEARFQWARALSFGPEEAEADRIRRKLAIGLDAVYAQDGENPPAAVEVSNGN